MKTIKQKQLSISKESFISPDSLDTDSKNNKNTKKNLLFIFTALLVVTMSFFLGYKTGDYAIASGLLQKIQIPKFSIQSLFQKTSKPKTSNLNPIQPKESSGKQASLTIGDSTLTTPKTPEEEKKFSEQVDMLSKETSTITINPGCEIEPKIPKIQEGKSVQMINNTDGKEVLTIGETGALVELEPKEKRMMPVRFNGAGIYSILCGSEGLSALLRVID